MGDSILLSNELLDVIEQRKAKERNEERIWIYGLKGGRWVFIGTGLKSEEQRYIERNLLVSYFPLPHLAKYPSVLNGKRGPKPTKVY